MTAPTYLIARLEAAAELNQHIVLCEAVEYAHAQRWISKDAVLQAVAWIEAGAYLDAALTLVPEGWEWNIEWADGRACCELGDPFRYKWVQTATPALAVCISALMVRDAA